MSLQIVILAAGMGTRMAGVTEEPTPKVLIPLRGKPVIKYLLESVSAIQKDTQPIIVVGFMHELVEKNLGDEYLYALQTEQFGTGHAVLTAREQVTAKDILVLNGDMPFIKTDSLKKLIDLHEATDSKVSMITGVVPNYEGPYKHFLDFGRIIRDEYGDIEKICEYKDSTEDQKQITEVNTGEYMFNTEWLWPHLEKIGSHNAQGEIYLTDIIELAIKDRQKVAGLQIAPEELYGLNTPEHLAHAQTLITE